MVRAIGTCAAAKDLDEDPDRRRSDQREVNERHEHAADARSIGCVQARDHRRQLSFVRTSVLHESRPRETLHFVAQWSIFAPSDDKDIVHSPIDQRGDQRPDERRPVRHRQQRLGAAHARRCAGGEDDAWDHEGIVLISVGLPAEARPIASARRLGSACLAEARPVTIARRRAIQPRAKAGGSAWESNPARPLLRRQRPILKTGRATGPRSLPLTDCTKGKA